MQDHTPIRGVIFDLDDTLFDCTGQLTIPARHRASAVLAPHTPLSEAELTGEQSELAEKVGSTEAIRRIGSRNNIPNDAIEEALHTYNRDDVPPIKPFDDAVSTIETLIERGLKIALVTTGRRNRQLSKIERTGLTTFFAEGSNLFIHEEGDDQPDKQHQLEMALASGDLVPEETLSVGDKLDSDIAVGNRIGLVTVRFRHGRQKDLEPSAPEERPDYDIHALSEILTIIPAN